MTMKLLALIILLISISAFAQTPKLNIRIEHNSSEEQEQKHQIEEFAKHYDLSKYTITRDIVINQYAANHSSPVLTLNLRFLGNEDDLILSDGATYRLDEFPKRGVTATTSAQTRKR